MIARGKLLRFKPKKMEAELKIVGSISCGRPWENPTGTLYTIRIGEKRLNNRRLAFKTFSQGEPQWIKKECEKEALKSFREDLTEKPHLFDDKEPLEALTKLITEHENIKLKIIGCETSFSQWADSDSEGVLYTLQIGDDPANIRLAFAQGAGGPVWIKKGKENEAHNSIADIAGKADLFDTKGREPREALIRVLLPEKGAGSNSSSPRALLRKALG